MIQRFNIDDLEKIMEIWLSSNIDSHPFVDNNYWVNAYNSVKEELPKADVFVYKKEESLLGFIGVVSGYIAGLFVKKAERRSGVGAKLLNYVKENNLKLSLNVYKKNTSAVDFYLKNDFIIAQKRIDEDTDEEEFVMQWTKNS